MPICHPYVFVEMSLHILCYFIGFFLLLLLLSYMSFFYILGIIPLSFANIFPHSLACFSVLLKVSFAVQKKQGVFSLCKAINNCSPYDDQCISMGH